MDDYLSEMMKKAKSSTDKDLSNEEEFVAKTVTKDDFQNFMQKFDKSPIVEENKLSNVDSVVTQNINSSQSNNSNNSSLFNQSNKIDLPVNDIDAEEDFSQTKSTIEKEIDQVKKVELTNYGKVHIYEVFGDPLKYYFVPTIRPSQAERKIINTLKEATTRLMSIIPYKIRNVEERRMVYKQKVLEIIKSNPSLKIPPSRVDFYAEAIVREMAGYGLIDDLIRDDQLEEIMIVGPKKPVFVFHRKYEMMKTNIEFYSETEIEDLINKIAREIGRRVDVSSPLLDARLLDGSRVNATIPPASISGGTLTIRKFREDPYSIIDLIKMGTLSSDAAAFLWICVDGLGVKPANILISGGTGSGKTTLLNVLTSFVPDRERVITIEDTAELNLPLKHWIRLEARPPGLEGTGELKMDILTKNSLRMRPDRIVVGEIRHEEAFTLFTAINTGHDGSLGTVHANSPEETLIRVTNPPMNVPQLMLSGLDFVICQHRYHDRQKGTIRRISEIAEVKGALEGHAKTETIFLRDPVKDRLEKTLINSKFLKILQDFTGLTNNQLQAEIEIRKMFLDNLAERNIRGLIEVKKEMTNFLSKRKFGEN
ncbi:MAG: CpaF family protein [Candidatus ainarchaeum sp.]|nr:CpaF family protein [Candidatus ainarchaeum sp.]